MQNPRSAPKNSSYDSFEWNNHHALMHFCMQDYRNSSFASQAWKKLLFLSYDISALSPFQLLRLEI
jgi:hypothetical protein